MTICEGTRRNDHEPIVIDGRCPLCEALLGIDERNSKIDELEARIAELEDQG